MSSIPTPTNQTAPQSPQASVGVECPGSGATPLAAARVSLRVLVVDDDPEILRAVERALCLAGWMVSTSDSPIDPEMVRADVVLTDYSASGPEMIRRCEAAGIPVVVLTASPEKVMERVAIVDKPFNCAELDAALSAACQVQP